MLMSVLEALVKALKLVCLQQKIGWLLLRQK